MLVRNITISFSGLIKKRLIFTAGVLRCATKPKICKSYHKSNDELSLQVLSSLYDTSVKQFMDVAQINELHKFCKPVNDLRNNYNFVIDETVAKDIARNVLDKTEESNQILAEGSGGLGLITINLINSGAQHVYVLDNYSLQNLSLHQIFLKFNKIVTMSEFAIGKPSLSLLILRILDLVKKHSLKFIGIFTNYAFLRGLVGAFIKDGLPKKNFEMYLILSSNVYETLKVYSPKCLKYTYYCLLNLFFNIHELAIYPRSAFLPFPKKCKNENMYLIKMAINSNISKNLGEAELSEFFMFISLLGEKNNFIIETLEKRLPNCGLYLISKGISMTNRIGDFSPQDAVNLFKLFQECEGYEDFKKYFSTIFTIK